MLLMAYGECHDGSKQDDEIRREKEKLEIQTAVVREVHTEEVIFELRPERLG